MIPHPYILLAFGVTLIAAGITGELHGRSVIKDRWELDTARRAELAATTLATAEKRAREAENASAAYAIELDLEHQAREQKINAAVAGNAERFTKLLRNAKASCGRDNLSAASGDSRINQEPATTDSVLVKAGSDLAEIKREVEKLENYAGACYAFSQKAGR